MTPTDRGPGHEESNSTNASASKSKVVLGLTIAAGLVLVAALLAVVLLLSAGPAPERPGCVKTSIAPDGAVVRQNYCSDDVPAFDLSRDR